jgi:pilus assembly protein TadC
MPSDFTSSSAYAPSSLSRGVLLLPNHSTLEFVLAAAASAGVGMLGSDAYLSHRQTEQIGEYRLDFPDLLDLLTVCVTAA